MWHCWSELFILANAKKLYFQFAEFDVEATGKPLEDCLSCEEGMKEFSNALSRYLDSVYKSLLLGRVEAEWYLRTEGLFGMILKRFQAIFRRCHEFKLVFCTKYFRFFFQLRVKDKDGNVLVPKNIPRIGKLPYGAKWGFIERKALLKERLYWKKGFIERKG